MRTTCCLNLPPPTSNQALNPSLIPIKPPQVSLANKEGSWRRQCVLMGVASYCAIIGLQMGGQLAHQHHHEAVAQEMMPSNYNSVGGGAPAKWSEKRACPPWRRNSLETVVPENLPRPAARRRYEAVRSSSKIAPPPSAAVELGGAGNCFSM